MEGVANPFKLLWWFTEFTMSKIYDMMQNAALEKTDHGWRVRISR